MNEKQKKKYLKKRGMLCPYCESKDIMASGIETTDEVIYEGAWCRKCKKQWTDVYTLTDVEEVQ